MFGRDSSALVGGIDGWTERTIVWGRQACVDGIDQGLLFQERVLKEFSLHESNDAVASGDVIAKEIRGSLDRRVSASDLVA